MGMLLGFILGVIVLYTFGYICKNIYCHHALKVYQEKAEDQINIYSSETDIVNKIVELTQKDHLKFNRYYNEQKTHWLSMPKGKVLVTRDKDGTLDVYIQNKEIDINDFEKTRLRTALGGERD